MTQQQDFKGELRATYTMRLLENAKCSVQTSTTGGLFMRVTLAVIYMYLIFISYLMLGIAGPVFTSTLFLVALPPISIGSQRTIWKIAGHLKWTFAWDRSPGKRVELSQPF